MKTEYKLINRKTGETHLCDKVIIDGFDYYVSDEFKSRWVYIPKDGIIMEQIVDSTIDEYSRCVRIFGNKNHKFILATNNSNIDIPKVVDEVEIKRNSILQSDEGLYSMIDKLSFKLGYNKAKETNTFSEEDMVEFGIWLHDTAFATYQVGGEYIGMWHIHYPDFTYVTSKELLQLWKSQKPKTVYYE